MPSGRHIRAAQIESRPKSVRYHGRARRREAVAGVLGVGEHEVAQVLEGPLDGRAEPGVLGPDPDPRPVDEVGSRGGVERGAGGALDGHLEHEGRAPPGG